MSAATPPPPESRIGIARMAAFRSHDGTGRRHDHRSNLQRMTAAGGTVNIARALWKDPTFKDSEMSEREAWIWWIAEASWKPREKRFQSTVCQLERSQLAASIRLLGGSWGWPKSRVSRFLDRLVKQDRVALTAGTDATLISIRNMGIISREEGKAEQPNTKGRNTRVYRGTVVRQRVAPVMPPI